MRAPSPVTRTRPLRPPPLRSEGDRGWVARRAVHPEADRRYGPTAEVRDDPAHVRVTIQLGAVGAGRRNQQHLAASQWASTDELAPAATVRLAPADGSLLLGGDANKEERVS